MLLKLPHLLEADWWISYFDLAIVTSPLIRVLVSLIYRFTALLYRYLSAYI